MYFGDTQGSIYSVDADGANLRELFVYGACTNFSAYPASCEDPLANSSIAPWPSGMALLEPDAGGAAPHLLPVGGAKTCRKPAVEWPLRSG